MYQEPVDKRNLQKNKKIYNLYQFFYYIYSSNKIR